MYSFTKQKVQPDFKRRKKLFFFCQIVKTTRNQK